jgi:hypothetical protein
VAHSLQQGHMAAGLQAWRLPQVHLGPCMAVLITKAKKHPCSHQAGMEPAGPGNIHTALQHPPFQNSYMAHCKTWEEWEEMGGWHTLCNRGTWQHGHKLCSCLRCILVPAWL